MLDEIGGGRAQLGDVMRRDGGRHADGDAGGAVGQQVREAARQNDRLGILAIIGVAEVDGVLVDAVEDELGDIGHPRFGVAHGGGVIAVDIAEVALPVNERIALREILRQPHQRVVDRLVAMRVIFTDHVADDTGAFLEAGIGIELEHPHRIEQTSVHGLQAVAHIRQRTVHDGRQSIGEVALLERVAQLDRLNAVAWATARNQLVSHEIWLEQRPRPRKLYAPLIPREQRP